MNRASASTACLVAITVGVLTAPCEARAVRKSSSVQWELQLPFACAMNGCDPTAKRHVIEGAAATSTWQRTVGLEAPSPLKAVWNTSIPRDGADDLDRNVDCLMSSAGTGPIVCGGGSWTMVGPSDSRMRVFKLSPTDGSTLLIAQVPIGSPSPVIPTSGVLAGAWNGTDVTSLYVSGQPLWDRGMQPQAPAGSLLMAPGLVMSKYLVFSQGGSAAVMASNQVFAYSASGVPVSQRCLSTSLGFSQAQVGAPPSACPFGSECEQRFFVPVVGSSCSLVGTQSCIVLVALDLAQSMNNILSIPWISPLQGWGEDLSTLSVATSQPVVLDPGEFTGPTVFLLASAVAQVDQVTTFTTWFLNGSSAGGGQSIGRVSPMWNASIDLAELGLSYGSPSQVSSALDQRADGSWSLWTTVPGISVSTPGKAMLVVTASLGGFSSGFVRGARVDTTMLDSCAGQAGMDWQVMSAPVLSSDGQGEVNGTVTMIVTLISTSDPSLGVITSVSVPNPLTVVRSSGLVMLSPNWCAVSSSESLGGQPLLIPVGTNPTKLLISSGKGQVQAWQRP